MNLILKFNQKIKSLLEIPTISVISPKERKINALFVEFSTCHKKTFAHLLKFAGIEKSHYLKFVLFNNHPG